MEGSGVMRKIRLLALGLLLAVPRATAAQSSDSPLTITEWTSSAQKSYPTGGAGTGVVGSSSDGVYTAWTQIIASTSNAWTITGLEVYPGDSPGDSIRWTVQIGVGAAAAETSIGELNGLSDSTSGDEWTPMLPTRVAAGSRISVRFKKVGTNTNTWRFAVTYIESPYAGRIASTTAVAAADYNNQHVHFPSVSGAWGNSAYQQLIASTATPIVVTRIVPDINTAITGSWGDNVELDISTGGVGAETVKWTVPFPNPLRSRDDAIEIRPGLRIAAGQRVALRMRDDTGFANVGVTVTYYADPSVDDITTTDAQVVTPSLAAPLTLTAGAAGAYGSYVEFISSTSSAIAVSGLSVNFSAQADYEIRVATGAAGSEVAISTYRFHGAQDAHGFFPIVPGLNIATGKRVALQVRASSGTPTTEVKIAYVASPTFLQRSSQAAGAWPTGTSSISTASLTPGGVWTPSAYVQVVAATDKRTLLTGISWHDSTASAKEMEFDVAIGSSGHETPIATFRTATYLNSGANRLDLRVPVPIALGSRVSIRLTNSSSGTTADRVAVQYVEDPLGFPQPDPPNVDALSLWFGHRSQSCHFLIPFDGVPVDGRASEPAGNSTCAVAVDRSTGIWYSKRSSGTWAPFGSVTSIAQTVPGGFSVTGSPITTSGTLAIAASGTSGGVLCYTGVTTSASSGALTANLPVFGGGAGVCPSSGTRSGNTTKVVTTTGTLPAGNIAVWDANGNAIDGGATGSNTAIKTIGITIDGGGSVPTTGIKGDIYVPYGGTINSVTLLADQSGSCVVDIWKDTYANYPPTGADSITASAKPTISSATKSQDSTLTGWTTTITAGDTIRFNLDSVTTITRIVLVLKVTSN
jgi:hypothetical protein